MPPFKMILKDMLFIFHFMENIVWSQNCYLHTYITIDQKAKDI